MPTGNRDIFVPDQHSQGVHPKVQVPVCELTQSKGQWIHERKGDPKVFPGVIPSANSWVSKDCRVAEEDEAVGVFVERYWAQLNLHKDLLGQCGKVHLWMVFKLVNTLVRPKTSSSKWREFSVCFNCWTWPPRATIRAQRPVLPAKLNYSSFSDTSHKNTPSSSTHTYLESSPTPTSFSKLITPLTPKLSPIPCIFCLNTPGESRMRLPWYRLWKKIESLCV